MSSLGNILITLISFLITSSLSCKNVTYGYYAYPLDFCVNYKAYGHTSSMKYACNSSQTGIESRGYSGSGCSGSSSDSGFSFTSFNCDEDLCTNVVVKTTYSTSSCSDDGDGASGVSVYLTDYCITYEGTSVNYKCQNSTLTQYMYSSGTGCTGTASSTNVISYTGKCSTTTYEVVNCNAVDESSPSPLCFSYSLLVYIPLLLFMIVIQM